MRAAHLKSLSVDEPLLTIADSKDPRGEFPFGPPEYIAHLLTVGTRYRDAQLERILRPLGLSVARHRALLVIQQLGPCTMTELADFSVVERTTLTRTVDQLVEAGLAARVSRGADRRTVQLTITQAGRELEHQAAALIWSQNRADLEGISDEEQRALIRVAQKFVANLAPNAVARERALTFRRPKGTRPRD
jgi:DNA-binding MarR family transcriptional regulator